MNANLNFSYIKPQWPAPQNVHALVTTRETGISQGVYAAFNLGLNTQDRAEDVYQCREMLQKKIGEHHRLNWLNQTHGIAVAAHFSDQPFTADASINIEKTHACVVLTADCLPIFLCDKEGSRVGVAHAGWRGLARGIIEATVKAMQCEPQSLMAWLGPAISQNYFEVGAEVKKAFVEKNPEAQEAFILNPDRRTHYFADLYHLARLRLKALGVTEISGGEFCTYEDPRFYSWRRDQGITGRMASVIWLS